MSNNKQRTADEKVEDLVGDAMGARLLHRRPDIILIEDSTDKVVIVTSDAMALRDWLNKVIP